MRTFREYCWPLLIPILVLTVFALISFRNKLWEHGVREQSNLTPRALSQDSKWLDIPPYLRRKAGAERGACEVLPWPPRWDADSGGWKESCNNEPHCSFVFRNACVQRNQHAEGDEPKWLVEMEAACQMPDHSLSECPLESGPSGDQIKVIRPNEGTGIQVEKGGFDPTPTILLDRSGGMPGNFYHDTSIAFYPLYVNMLLQGWDDYTGRRIAVVDAYSFPPKGQKGLAELYYVYNQSEVVDWRDFPDRKCFREVTFMRTEFKWRCRDHRVVPSPALNGYANLVASHFGLPEERPPLPETPALFFLYRGGSRKLTNWDELSKSLEIPYRVHNTSQSWRQQIEEVRQSSILFGLHGAGHSLLLHAPLGAVIIEVYNHGKEDPRMFRNQAVASGRSYMKHLVRDESAIHRASPFGAPMDDPITYHYADMELAKEDFHSLIDTAIQIVSTKRLSLYYSNQDF